MRIFCLLLFLTTIECLDVNVIRRFDAKNSNDVIHFDNEKHLQNVKQLTFGGANAEGL